MPVTAAVLLFALGTATGAVIVLLVTRFTGRPDARLRDTFQALSADALARNNQAFLQLARTELERAQTAAGTDLERRQTGIEALLAPIRDGLAQYDGKLQAIERARLETFGAIAQRLDSVAAASDGLRAETLNLVTALRTPHVRGQWGEVQLRRVCELAGMLEHCDFATQETVTGDAGRLRPDLVVRLAGGKTIVVDAKTPLQAYLDATAATDEPTRRRLMGEHARQLCAHVDALGRKAYWEQFEHAPELVVLFLPMESLYGAALEAAPHLIEAAAGQRVLIATPTTLIALLKAMAHGWRQDALARNAAEISLLGKELYERLRTFGAHLDDVGRGLGRAVDSYNKAVGSLEARVLPSARRFRTLQTATGEEIPPPEPVDELPRSLAAAELVASRHATELPA